MVCPVSGARLALSVPRMVLSGVAHEHHPSGRRDPGAVAADSGGNVAVGAAGGVRASTCGVHPHTAGGAGLHAHFSGSLGGTYREGVEGHRATPAGALLALAEGCLRGAGAHDSPPSGRSADTPAAMTTQPRRCAGPLVAAMKSMTGTMRLTSGPFFLPSAPERWRAAGALYVRRCPGCVSVSAHGVPKPRGAHLEHRGRRRKNGP